MCSKVSSSAASKPAVARGVVAGGDVQGTRMLKPARAMKNIAVMLMSHGRRGIIPLSSLYVSWSSRLFRRVPGLIRIICAEALIDVGGPRA